MLVVSGCIAKKEKSTITWTIDDLQQAHTIYSKDCRDCKSLGIKFNRNRPTRENLPCKDTENLVFEPGEHPKMINVAKYYGNEQKFLDLLRFLDK